MMFFSVIYIIITLITLIACYRPTVYNILNFDNAIMGLVILCVIVNICMFVLNVYHSKAYRDYLIEKKNQEII